MTDDKAKTPTEGDSNGSGAGAPHLTDANFAKTLEGAGDQPVFVDFYADWCGPCKISGPIVDKLAGEYKGKVKVTKLNVDDNNDTAGKYGVMSIPTVIMFKAGKEVERKVGYPGEDGYRKLLDGVLKA